MNKPLWSFLIIVVTCMWPLTLCLAKNDCREPITTFYAGVDPLSKFGTRTTVGDCILSGDSFVQFHQDGSADYQITARTTQGMTGTSTDAMHVTIDIYGKKVDLPVCDNLNDSWKNCTSKLGASTFDLTPFSQHSKPAFAWEACC
jgi:hypothetical protein